MQKTCFLSDISSSSSVEIQILLPDIGRNVCILKASLFKPWFWTVLFYRIVVVSWLLLGLKMLPHGQFLFPLHSIATESITMKVKGTCSWSSEPGLCHLSAIWQWIAHWLLLMWLCCDSYVIMNRSLSVRLLQDLSNIYTLYCYTVFHLSHSFGNFCTGKVHRLCAVMFLGFAVLSNFIERETCETCKKLQKLINR